MTTGLAVCLGVLLMLVPAPPCFGSSQQAAHARSGDADAVVFPVEFRVAPGNGLYLYGERIEEVRLTTSPGDSLYLNGVPILPPPSRQPPWYEPPSDQDYLKWYGDIPFVQALLAQGVSPRDAAESYREEQESVVHRLVELFCDARTTQEDDHAALEAAIAGLPGLDDLGLVDWGRPPLAAPSGLSVRICWKGEEDSRWTTFLEPCVPPAPCIPTEEVKAARAERLMWLLTSDVPCWWFIGYGGSDLYRGREAVAEVRSELETLLSTGDPSVARALGYHEAREILAAFRGDGGLPN